MKQTNIELYEKVFLIRYAEERIIELYPDDYMKTPMHMSMGGDAIASGVCQALEPDDQVLGTYRSHALYLAKTDETDNFFLEMYGKKSDIANGRSGSMHLSSLDRGLLCCSAIVGSTVPMAVGAAFANKYKENGVVVAAFFGDGATDEGVFWESINFACLKQLPILFVYEDNDIAVHSFNKARQGFKTLTKIVAQYNINVFEEIAVDPERVYNTTKTALEIMKVTHQPSFVRFSYHRYLEHVGISEDYTAGYRIKEDYKEWYDNDPVKIQRKKLIALGVSDDEIQNIENRIRCRVNESVKLAEKGEFVEVADLCKGVYY